MRFGFWWGFKPILENCVFFAVFDPFYHVNEAKTSNQFPLMKTSTEIFQKFLLFLNIKRHQKNTQAKVLEKLPHDNTLYWSYWKESCGVILLIALEICMHRKYTNLDVSFMLEIREDSLDGKVL